MEKNFSFQRAFKFYADLITGVNGPELRANLSQKADCQSLTLQSFFYKQ